MPRIVASLLLVLAACGHVELRTPAASTPAERLRAYEELRPVAAGVTVERSSGTIHSTNRLVLASGESVRYPEDLIPVVDDDSPTARQARRAKSNRGWKWGIGAATLAGILAGTAWTVLAITAPSGDEEINDTAVYAGIALSTLSTLGGGITLYVLENAEKDARGAAFATYDASLRTRLSLCVNGLQVVPCEGAAAP